MRKVDHPCCIRLLDLYYDDLHVYLVQELARGGELLERIAAAISFSERDAALIFRQILRGLEYLHSMGIAHRDMKPENILMVSRDVQVEEYYAVKLADYGFASLKADVLIDTMKTPCGTPEYIAPEIIKAASNKGDPNAKYSAKVDVWSGGAILYTMLCGTSPFLCADTNTMLLMIRDGRYAFAGPAWQHVSNQAQSFISRILKVNPKVRPSASECLRDPWILQAEKQVDSPLSVKDALSSYCSHRKARRAGLVVQAVGRFTNLRDTEDEGSRAQWERSAWSAQGEEKWKGMLTGAWKPPDSTSGVEQTGHRKAEEGAIVGAVIQSS